MSSIVAASAKDNPYVFYRQVLHQFLYPAPSAGYQARVAVWLTLAACSFVLACVYGGLIVYTHVREGKKLWLWRLVSRTQGRYILGNAANLWVICCLVNIVLQIAFVSLVYEIYAHDGSQSSIYFWRTLVLIPIVVHGHVATWNMLQASVLTNEHNRTSRLLTPRIANATFVLLSVLLILAPNIVVGVVLGYKFDNVVAEANALDAELAALEAGWTGALDLQALTGLLARQQALSDEVTSTSRLAIALYAIYALTIVIILGVNFASVGLLNQIQSQIKFNTSLIASSGSRNHLNSGGSHRFAASAPPRVSLNEAVFVTIASEVHVDGTTSAIEPPPPVLKPAQETVPIPSLSKLRPPRPRRESAGGVAIQLAAMRKIKADLLTFVVAITLVGLTYLGLCIWLCCSWANLNTTWYWIEIPVMLPVWIYQAAVFTVTCILLRNIIRQMRAQSREAGSFSAQASRASVDPEKTAFSRATAPSLGDRKQSSASLQNSLVLSRSLSRAAPTTWI